MRTSRPPFTTSTTPRATTSPPHRTRRRRRHPRRRRRHPRRRRSLGCRRNGGGRWRAGRGQRMNRTGRAGRRARLSSPQSSGLGGGLMASRSAEDTGSRICSHRCSLRSYKNGRSSRSSSSSSGSGGGGGRGSSSSSSGSSSSSSSSISSSEPSCSYSLHSYGDVLLHTIAVCARHALEAQDRRRAARRACLDWKVASAKEFEFIATSARSAASCTRISRLWAARSR